ncbi:MAG: hypothetical protein R2741_03005 [Methanolobus sp.]
MSATAKSAMTIAITIATGAMDCAAELCSCFGLCNSRQVFNLPYKNSATINNNARMLGATKLQMEPIPSSMYRPMTANIPPAVIHEDAAEKPMPIALILRPPSQKSVTDF